MKPRGRLLRKYIVLFGAVVSGVLLASGALEIYFSYQEAKAALAAIQREKALAAATRIEQFVREIERQLGWTTHPLLAGGAAALEQRRIDYFRLQRQVPAITELSHLDATGHEQIRVSRLAMDLFGSSTDYSRDPRFLEAGGGRTYFSPVYFRKESEPYMTVSMSGGGSGQGVTVAEVNLKFIWDVVSQIKIGRAGQAYVVDARGQLIAHPDISLVLKKSDLSGLEQVQAARAAAARRSPSEEPTQAQDLQGRRVLAAYAPITPLGWLVIVEQPLTEAFQPIYASVIRTALLVLAGVGLSGIASLVLARRMVRPIQTLGAGAAQIGAGDLGHRIQVRTGDEIEALADEFNRMATTLQESYAGLERKVEERTRELTEALEQQTATAEILRVISSSPTDVQPVMDAVAENAARLCNANDATIIRTYEGTMRRVAHFGPMPALFPAEGRPLTRESIGGAAALERRTIHIADMLDESVRQQYPESAERARQGGFRTMLAVPLLREGTAIGVIAIRRTDVRAFTDKQVELVKTFADQAVIAIENVRLFQELQARTRDLAQSLEEVRALSEVSQAVSASLDLRRVLDTVARHAVNLSGCDACGILEFNASRKAYDVVASHNLSEAYVQSVQAALIDPRKGIIGRATETGQPVQIADIATGEGVLFRDITTREGFHALLAVPMSAEGVTRGIVLFRRMPGRFDDRVVTLLSALASQSKLAIENARLFQEVEDKGRQIEVANQHKSDFLAAMSHELRTPLNAVIGFSEVLLERMFGDLNPKQEEYLHDIVASGRHLLSLINDILDLAKVEAGRMDLDLASFNLPAALDNALTLVRERAARHGIAVASSVDARVDRIIADERKFKQIVLNLLSNAIKFTPEGGRVDVSAASADGAVEISVSDTGIGIAPEDQEAIFEEFRQVGNDVGRKREGTGLGLPLAKKFVELHGGRIWVKSRVGAGSTFTFTLPLQPAR
ncbi:MAG TPA: ATP-binding protein [Methylomirabilota bacterium]|nr:ATP-binding protein [Methylomirabilota bacterium]